MIYFTSSWDDGSVYDIKLSEILLKNNQKATFFIPLFNIEKRDVINSKQILDIANEFEIGAHTLTHRYLTRISNKEAEYEIKQSKKELEAIINRPVYGFCFPGGKYKQIHIKYINQAGFKYARTINMFKYNNTLKNSNNTRIMNTTLQAYNHSKIIYFMHLIKRGYIITLIQNSISILTHNKWDKLLFDILDKHLNHDSPQKMTIIHLWGHSWEIQENNMWQQLENFLEHLNNYQILSRTNFEISLLNHKLLNTPHSSTQGF
jgi:peptidoglycan/xylan/chitin deacetylase (PgdA/CDA1 family)